MTRVSNSSPWTICPPQKSTLLSSEQHLTITRPQHRYVVRHGSRHSPGELPTTPHVTKIVPPYGKYITLQRFRNTAHGVKAVIRNSSQKEGTISAFQRGYKPTSIPPYMAGKPMNGFSASNPDKVSERAWQVECVSMLDLTIFPA